MQAKELAPWAELAPREGALTVDELLALPDDGWMYELVEGRLVRMPPSGIEASSLAVRLGAQLFAFVENRGLGIITGGDGGYVLSPGTVLAPDVAFVRAEHVLPRTSPDYEKAWPVAPDLVAEVASPNQHRPEMAAKVQRYLAAGVRLVWVVWPRRRQVDVSRPGDTEPRRTLGIGDTLDGLDVVPGFTYSLEQLFA
jgi:Uma2 family endonuclease